MFLLSSANLYSLFLLVIFPYYYLLCSFLMSLHSSSRFTTRDNTSVRRYPLALIPFLPHLSLFCFFNTPHLNAPCLLGQLTLTSSTSHVISLLILVTASLFYNFRGALHFDSTRPSDLASFLLMFSFLVYLIPLTSSLISFTFVLEALTTTLFILVTLWSDVAPNHFKTPQPYAAPFEALFFFFWTSFFVAIGIFYSVSTISAVVGSTDWLFFEHLIQVILGGSLQSFALVLSTFFLLFLAIVVKFAFAPFFFWKPIFFKMLPPSALAIYVVFFYSTLFFWFFSFWCSLSPLLTGPLFLVFSFLFLLGLPCLLALLTQFDRLYNLITFSSVFNGALLWLLFAPTGAVLSFTL